MSSDKLTFSYDAAGFGQSDMQSEADRIRPYIDHIADVAKTGDYGADEASVVLPADDDLMSTIGVAVDALVSEDLRWIVVIGIGGSNLGTMAVYEALRGKEYNMRAEAAPKMFFLDTTSSKRFELLRSIIAEEIEAPEQIVVNAISKSGGTTETIAALEAVMAELTAKFGKEVKDRVVLTTGKDSKFWNHGKKLGMQLLPIPDKVGGRYSVLSAVGLFPLMLAGIFTEDLRDGALAMRNRALGSDIAQNPALASAALTYLHLKAGRSISNSFFFNPEFEAVGKWYRQLMGESVGKQFDLDGNEVRTGITPIVAIGSTDLHSMAQLFYGGPDDKFTTLVYAPESKDLVRIPAEPMFPLVDGIAGKSFADVMDAIYGGVAASYKAGSLPFAEVHLPRVSPYHVGEYLQFKMLEMMYLAKLMNVNAFDQPNVEDYKVETKKLLEQ
ncbi:MAG: Glucose-6-phosphate isomerase [candidate division WS6 bacterium OLB20]|uniref:Glucose-6-phosphate isomerase n=1 Tax=candidate division WS6 bacterium OLB20 TaxID=1617426 RepID=A0A136LZ19_9BACT|nr:MAG: Glucose-6-phosphate isomerase [candidate division WS6 bacterium OLB20]